MERKIEYDFEGRLAAPEVDKYIKILDGASNVTNTEAIQEIVRLFDILEMIKPIDKENERRELWIEAPRGTIEEYGNYEELSIEGKFDSYEEFENDWKESYPKESSWYHLFTIKNEDYMVVFLQNRKVLEVQPRSQHEDNDYFGSYLFPFIKWLADATRKSIDLLKNGIYNQYVNQFLDGKNKTGTILRNDYWKVFPEEKKYYLQDISQDEIEEFTKLIRQNIGVDEPENKLSQMTSELFFHCCELGYRSNYNEDNAVSAKDLYKKHADGRDEGLCELDEKDPVAFETWFHDKTHFGGHPWEVCRGGNSTHVDLRIIKKDDGYYFHTAGKAWNRSVETTKFFLAIFKAGYPITIEAGREMADRFLGLDKIGIVPNGVVPKYCKAYFPAEKILDFMNVYDEDLEVLEKYIKWQDIEKIELIQK